MIPLILLVDDNAVQATTRSMILSRTGLQVEIAQFGEQAISLLERSDFRASLRLLITDHLMPGMNGPELVRRVREILPLLPVMVLSGMADAEPEYDDLQVSFQLKPFPPNELIRLTSLLIGDSELRSA